MSSERMSCDYLASFAELHEQVYTVHTDSNERVKRGYVNYYNHLIYYSTCIIFYIYIYA